MEAIFVGIDVSKDRLDVHVRPSGEAFVVTRDGKGLEELVERLRALAPTLIAVEATGGFETIVAAAVAGAGLPLAVVNPAQVRHFAQAVGKRAKTDPIDAEMIARFAEAVKPEPRSLPDAAARLLAELVGRRRQIIEMLVPNASARSAPAMSACARASPAISKSWNKNCRTSTATSQAWCAVPRSGAKRKTCWSRSRASKLRSPAPSWPSCRNLAL